ncbi:MAG: metal-dependent hydrolase [Lautropia sp.]
MDSLTQIVLGAAVGIATMGRRTAIWKAALWGGACGTLPDLDVIVDHGDPIRNMTLHRTESHALFYLTLAAPAIAGLIAAIHRDGQFRRWWLLTWLALITHPLLDLMTVYGTQLGLPFTDTPYYVGSVFVIDPLYTLPLVIGVAAALRLGHHGLRWNAAGLLLSTAYLGWGLAAQAHVRGVAESSLAHAGITASQLLVTPTAFNSVLWRVVAISPDGWHEGFRSLLDPAGDIRFVRRPTGAALAERHGGDWYVRRVAWFSHGFFDATDTPDGLQLRDLRMGWGDNYTFTFVLPAVRDGASAVALPQQRPLSIDPATTFSWLWRRLLGDPAAAPS